MAACRRLLHMRSDKSMNDSAVPGLLQAPAWAESCKRTCTRGHVEDITMPDVSLHCTAVIDEYTSLSQGHQVRPLHQGFSAMAVRDAGPA